MEEYTSKLHSNSKVREIALDPTKPALKRRRSTTTTLGVSSIDTKTDSDHSRPVTHSDVAAALSPEDQSILRDATEEEAVAKRVKLSEPEAVDDLGDMDTVHVSEHSRLQVGDVKAVSSKLACDSCGEEFCLFWCAGPTDGSGRREASTEPVEPCDSCGKVPCLFWCAGPTDGSGRREVFTPRQNAMRDIHANAAEQRASDAALRGIGDPQASSELDREAAKQEAAGTRSIFGASAALKLRKHSQ